jgi:hypothetical protein
VEFESKKRNSEIDSSAYPKGSKEKSMNAKLDKTISEKNASCSGRSNISMLTEEERIQITKALRQWANQAPEDELVIEFVGGDRCLTPLQVYIEVERNTRDGQAVLKILEHGVRQEGIQQVISLLTDQGV